MQIRIQKGLIDVVTTLFPHANHKFCFRHMYKNMKKFYRGTQIEWLVWSAAKAVKQSEKNKHMDQLKLENPAAHDWLLKEPFEHWVRSHFNFTAKCEHITNNFSESFNMRILKTKDRPIHKLLEKLNIMLMKLMYDRRLKAKEWEEASLVLVPRAQTHIDKMIKCYGQYQPTNHFLPPPLVRGAGRPRKQRIPDSDEEIRQKRCRKCGGYGHNKKTCKGAPATSRPRVARAPKRVDTNVSMAGHMYSVGLPPVTPNIRGRGSGGIGSGGGNGRSARGTRQTYDTEAPRPTQTSQAPMQTRASTQQVQAPRQTQSRQTQNQNQATQGLRQSQS
ncbi:hypothetical protein GIB67_037230, partial [Kingdonia uniflora]